MPDIIATASDTLPFPGNPPIEYNLWHLRNNLYCLRDSLELGNMLICDAPQGLAAVDAKLDACHPGLYNMIKNHFNKPLRWLINTHCHPDHAGGNIGMCDDKPQIIAHVNCADRLKEDQMLAVLNEHFAALALDCQPNHVFNDTLTLYLGVETLTLKHLSGHTDGDIMIFCTNANIVHTGDLCSFGGFPYIGLHEGGNIHDMTGSLWQLYDAIDDETIVVPGHGEPGNKRVLGKYIKMLASAANNVKVLLDKGAGLTDVVDACPASELAATCRPGVGPLNGATFTEVLYADLSRASLAID